MFGIILAGLAMLAVLSAGSYSMMMMVNNTTSLISAQTEKQNQQKIEMSLNHALKPYGKDRALVAPIDTSSTVEYNGKKYLSFPSKLGLSTLNVWKMPYVYCPVSGDSQTITDTTSAREIIFGDTTYSIVSFDDKIDDGINYVTQSNLLINSQLSDKKTLAIVLSPRMGTDIPSCSDVYIKPNGKYGFNSVDGKKYSGLITVISRDETSNFTGIPNHIVDLNDFDSNASFDGLVSSWEAIKPLRYTVDLNDGNQREIEQDLVFENNSPSLDKSFILKSSSTSSATITASSEVTITFKDMVVDLTNINFSNNINLKFDHSKVKFDDITLNGKLSLTNSELNIVSDSSIVGASTSGLVDIRNSVINQVDSVFSAVNRSSNFALSMSGTKWTVSEGSSLSVQSASGSSTNVLNIKDQSALSVKESSYLVLNSSSGSANSIINVDASSSVSLKDSYISSSSSTGVLVSLMGTMALEDSSVNTSNVVSTAFNVDSGNLKFYSSSLTPSSTMQLGFNLKNGAEITLQDSEVGSNSKALVIGVRDISASSVYGKETNIYANTCLSGYLFEDLAITGSSTPAEDSIQKTTNRSAWVCR